MNKLHIIGRLVKDPETRMTQSGKNVCNFTVAVNRRGREEADFFRVNAWGQLGDVCARFLVKSAQVSVVGSVTASAYMGKDGSARASLDVFAEDVEFIGPKLEAAQKAPETPKRDKQTGFVQVEEDIPF